MNSKAYPMVTIDELKNNTTIPDAVKVIINLLCDDLTNNDDEPASQALRGFLCHNFKYHDDENEGHLRYWEVKCKYYIDGCENGTCDNCESLAMCDNGLLNMGAEEREKWARQHLSEEHQIEWLMDRLESWADWNKYVDLHIAAAIFRDGWTSYEINMAINQDKGSGVE